ncbi:MAG: Transcriptional regulator WhiB1 [Actinomycetota bacterium]|jgi:WhiB family redox-sensing transcriptional regulator
MPAHTQVPYTTLEVTPVPLEIQLYGECGNAEPELFFRDDVRSQHKALSICGQCPVQKLCLSYALDNEEYGVWGGTTESQRVALRGKTKLVTPEQRRHAAMIREAIATGNRTVREIAAAHEVTERTVYRYKARMRQDGLLPLGHENDLATKRSELISLSMAACPQVSHSETVDASSEVA